MILFYYKHTFSKCVAFFKGVSNMFNSKILEEKITSFADLQERLVTINGYAEACLMQKRITTTGRTV